MKKWFILACICLFSYNSNAQNKYADSLKRKLANTQDPLIKFKLQDKLLEYSYISGATNPDSSYCINLLDIAQEMDNDSMLAVAYNQVGNSVFRNNGDLGGALEYFFKAIPFAEAANDKRRISSLYIDIAAVYYKLNNKPEQAKYIRKAFDNLPDKNSPLYAFMLLQAQYHISRYFLSLSQNDSALYYAQALAVTNLNLKSPFGDAASNGLMAQAYDKMGDSTLAALYMSRANTIYDSIHYLWGKIEGKKDYLAFLVKHNKFSEAKTQALLLLNIGEQQNTFDAKRIAAGYLTIIYGSYKQTDSALYYSRLESAMKDSLFNQDNLNKIQSLAFNEHIRIMEEEDRQADEAEQRRIDIQYALIFLGIVAFIIIFFLLTNSIIITEKLISFLAILGLLIVFEFINLLIHPFLERATHHCPILMLLALIVIASMLIPLHHKLEHWIRTKMTEKNKKIRLAAAKKTIEQLGKVDKVD